MIQSISFEIGGKELSIETGRVAKQASGAVLLGMGETVVLGTATMSQEPRQGLDFFPLVCDYEERKYAVGKIPGGFIKRGGRPSEKAVLTSRLIDRPVRPLFPKGMRNDVQCIAMPFAVDQECPPDVLGIIACSAALTISDIPWDGPIGAVRIGLVDGEFVVFPTVQQAEESQLDLIVAGTKDNIIMVESGAAEVSEETMVEAMKLAQKHIRTICEQLEALRAKAGKAKREVPLFLVDEEVIETVKREAGEEIRSAIVNPDKAARESALSDLAKSIIARLAESVYAQDEEKQKQLPEAVDTVIKKSMRNLIVKDRTRPDGRGLTDIRQIAVEPGLLPRVHGSGLFTRGQTQVMTVVTLGTPSESQTLDGLEEIENKRYMHFYNFPPYSVGEVRPLRGPGRREIGHGALAERALKQMIPSLEEFPYSLLLVSEVLESNGSTSMASVCGSTVALLDCGVPLKAPVAGIAMGLINEGDEYVVLTDIQGMEDFSGDMDFKVAGTRDGITALQLDTKIGGIPEEVLARALNQAKDARFYILDKIDEAIPERRTELNPNAPRITVLQIDPAKIGELIGPSGKTIKRIIAETGAQIDVEQDGRVYVATKDKTGMDAAIRMIEGMTKVPGVGDKFSGPVTRLMGRGAMVEFLPGREGLVAVEDLTTQRVRRPDDVVKVGDVVNVQVREIDSLGRVNLTAMGLEQEVESLADNVNQQPDFSKRESTGRGNGGRGRFGDRDRDRGRDRDRDRDRDRGRGPRDRDRDRGERPPREETRDRAAAEPPAGEPEFRARSAGGFPKKESGEDTNVGARFRPKR
ncbi:MAG: polyribonucleotide nucleotidyltransferase [Armatimonadetes bacterium]|nr:polyribonucleotide nucleotidyltransferase [Armatimonadota bacterium]NOG92340.1 polyribonucleotide nucleotidyltransferase [Armatimonadota bacterium]